MADRAHRRRGGAARAGARRMSAAPRLRLAPARRQRPMGPGRPVRRARRRHAKLCCMIARPAPGRGVQLLGRGYQLAEGLKAGEIVDAEAAEASVLAALHEAEQQAGEVLREVVLAVERRAAAVELRPRRAAARRPGGGRGRRRACCSTAPGARSRRPSARWSTSCRSRSRSTTAGRLRDPCGPGRPEARGGGALRHRRRARRLRNVLACLERCHVAGQGRGRGELRRRHRLPRRGRGRARLPGPRPGRRHHGPRPLRRTAA